MNSVQLEGISRSTVTVRGHPIACWHAANLDLAVMHRRPLVVLIHGLGSGGGTWFATLPALHEAGWAAIAPDLPGFGDTPPVAGRSVLDPGFYVLSLTGLLQELGYARAVWLGWSLGGAVALHLALEASPAVAGLVLVASAGLGRSVHWGIRLLGLPWLGRFLTRPPKPGLEDRLGTGLVRLPRMIASQPVPAAFVAYHMRIARNPWVGPTTHQLLRQAHVPWLGQGRFSLRHRVSELRGPALFLWGSDDRIIPARHGRRAQAQVDNSRWHEWPETGHCLPVERPEAFSRVLIDFLNEHRDIAPPSN